MTLPGTAASMLETIRVERQCWANDERGVAMVQFRVTWKTPIGVATDAKYFDFKELMQLPVGVTAMLVAIFDPTAGEPRIEAHVYLLRVTDPEDGLPDVVARLIVQTEHAGPDEPFVLSGPLTGRLEESGPNIYPVPIHDTGQPVEEDPT